jgi:hypothetical protein
MSSNTSATTVESMKLEDYLLEEEETEETNNNFCFVGVDSGFNKQS